MSYTPRYGINRQINIHFILIVQDTFIDWMRRVGNLANRNFANRPNNRHSFRVQLQEFCDWKLHPQLIWHSPGRTLKNNLGTEDRTVALQSLATEALCLHARRLPLICWNERVVAGWAFPYSISSWDELSYPSRVGFFWSWMSLTRETSEVSFSNRNDSFEVGADGSDDTQAVKSNFFCCFKVGNKEGSTCLHWGGYHRRKAGLEDCLVFVKAEKWLPARQGQ